MGLHGFTLIAVSGKRVYGQLYQGFKSLSLRHKPVSLLTGFFVLLLQKAKHKSQDI